LLAAHMRVLSLLSGKSDVVTGLVSNGRPEETDGERVIGLILNTLPYRLQLLGGTWIDLVNKSFEVEQELIPFRRYPLPELQRILGRQSLFETAFNFTNFHVYKKLSNISIEVLDGKSFSPTNFSFLAEFQQSPFSSQVYLHLDYDNTVFFEQQIQAIGGYYVNTLTAMVSKPNGCYKSHALISAQEQNQLLVEWNNTQTEYPIDQCIHQLFEAQVERTPDAVAVVFEDEQLTYQELNARANQLAHYLQKLGVKPEVLVGICVERSLEMAIGLLAILKAGGAYVPLDPSYPKERLAFMLEDTQVSVLLTQQRLVEELPKYKARIVCLDEDWKDIAHASQGNLACGVTMANLAYVIYTSGSTGKPKGICLPQRSLMNLLQWHFSSLLNGARTLQFASLSFDASFHEIFATWGSGGTLFILSENLRMDAVGLGRFLSEQAIEKVILPVVVLQLLAESVGEKGIAPLHSGLFNTLREITTTGEQLQVTRPIIKLLKSLEHCSLHNHYGPSETHVVTALSLENNPDEWSFYPPIGKPITNTQIYIVDQQFNIVPLGVTGELYIGGVSLAQGYLNRPDLTSEKFIPNPFSEKPGTRLYKTGDLARYLPNGNIEYLGRIDHQVKIRGFRIELGEIEAVLSQYPAIREVVVLDQKDETGNKRLVAYVVSDKESTSISGELRYFLHDKLPSYMVPSAFVFLEALPLTPNGKVDRKALPIPDLTRPELQRTFVPPRTVAEEMVADIWRQVLGIEKIGIHDNFFELGGHSLMTTQVISRIRQIFQIELPIRSLFKSPTIEGLVDAIAQIWGTHEVVEEIARTWKELAQIPTKESEKMLLREKLEIQE
ncbi:MAG: non-ribosomal peptide synthetase, partial [Nostoc sp.]